MVVMVTLERSSGVEWRKPEPADKAEWEWAWAGHAGRGRCVVRGAMRGWDREARGSTEAQVARAGLRVGLQALWAAGFLGAGTRCLHRPGGLRTYLGIACSPAALPLLGGEAEPTGRKLRLAPPPLPSFPLPPGRLASWTLWFVHVARARPRPVKWIPG